MPNNRREEPHIGPNLAIEIPARDLDRIGAEMESDSLRWIKDALAKPGIA